ncbi:hypothetical protein [Bifidobacterium pseudolongum]|uniref:hypothetical protein n=1 Tax=Bifidobacterium pseudolongum TaxID=1694 RepID=UPI0010221205|nr:hypothetical protein [Bifidobacterium pseudolongum]
MKSNHSDKLVSSVLGAISALLLVLGTGTTANAIQPYSTRINVPCTAQQHSNQAKLTCTNSPVYVRAKIACRMWPDQYTGWIKNGVSYSGGCPFGMNDTASGNPVSMEVGSA